MATTPEGKVKKLVDAALKKLGADCYRFMPVQSGFGAKTLDYLLCIKGKFIAIETKAPGKHLTPLQVTTATNIENAGGLVYVVYDQYTLDIVMARIALMMEFDSDPNYPRDARSPLTTSVAPTRTP